MIDNSVILLSLLVTRHQLRKSRSIYSPSIRRKLLKRINRLISEYRNPDRGIEFNDPDIAHEAQ